MTRRREHLPSPVKQHVLWSSPLKGMERPVRSFKSFIQALPPNPSPNDYKPLPPIPSSPTSPRSHLPPVRPPLKRVPSENSWHAPPAWAWGSLTPPGQHLETTSAFSLRSYSPLLPEPSADLSEMDFETSIAPLKTASRQHAPLVTIPEAPTTKPDIPSRNPSRFSPFQIPSPQSDPGLVTTSDGHRVPTPYPLSHRPSSYPNAASELRINAASSQASVLRNERSAPLTKGEVFVSSNSGPDKKNESSFANDQHKLWSSQKLRHLPEERLAESVLTNDSKNITNFQPMMPTKDQSYTVEPLTWRKNSKGSNTSPNVHIYSGSPSPHRGRFKSMVASLHHFYDEHKRRNSNHISHQRSASDPGISPRKKTVGSDIKRLLHVDVHRPKLLTRPKLLRLHTKAAPPTNPSHYSPTSPVSPKTVVKKPTPLVRLPLGLAVVRQPPSAKPLSPAVSSYDVSPMTVTPRKRPKPPSPTFTPPQQSSISAQSSSTPAPSKKRLGTLVDPRRSPHSRHTPAHTPPSPSEQELTPSRTPPLPPHQPRSRFSISVSVPAKRYYAPVQRNRDESKDTNAMHVRRILDKARNARDAWRNHQKEMKHQKLKQSIKVLGPTDPRVLAGYVKSDGRRSKMDQRRPNEMPAHMVTSPV
ncbi:hypothetical protein IQ07DRAFT_639727 [Pyrenochaeta sp. DS3sAY3a]|nr:hypothetical protein IQ07DRAFT_639727 [Pyrenochaeta sp. DS3sAY3a]